MTLSLKYLNLNQFRNKPGSNILWVVIVAAVYFIAGRLSLNIVFKPAGIAAIWPASGVFLSAILLTKKELRPYLIGSLFITDWIIEVLAGSRVDVSLVYAFALTFDAVLSAWLLVRFIGEPVNFRKARQVAGFVLLSVIFSNAVASCIASVAPSLILGESYWESWKWWWSSDAVGNLLITPFILSWANHHWNKERKQNLKWVAEALLLFLSMIVVHFIVFRNTPDDIHLLWYLNFSAFPFLLWAALRFGVKGVTTIILILTVQLLTLLLGPHSAVFIIGSQLVSIIVFQLYLAVVTLSSLFLASIVNEREDVNASLLINKNILDGIFTNSPNLIYLLDTEGKFIMVNQVLGKKFGLPQKEFIGKNREELMFKEIAGQHRNNDLIIINTGQSMSFEEENLENDGKHYYLTTKFPLVDQDGKVYAVGGISKDITDRKRYEDELKQVSLNWNKTFDAIVDGIAILDADQHIVQTNKAFNDYIGKSQGDLKGKNCFNCVHGTNCPIEDCPFVRMKASRKRETMELNQDDLFCEIIVDPIIDENDNIIGAVHIVADISERKLAEKALQNNQEQHEIIIRTAMDGYWLVSKEGQLIEVNDTYCSMSGYTREELLTMNISDLEVIEDVEDIEARIQKVIQKGEDRFETKHRRKNGSIFEVEVSAQFKQFVHGRLVAFIKDITHIKRNQLVQRILLNISNEAAVTEDLAEFIRLIQQEMGSILDARNFFVALYDEATDKITLPYFDDEFDELTEFPAGKTLTKYLISTKKPLLANKEKLNSLVESGEVESFGGDALIWLGVPLKIEDRVIGAMVVQSYSDSNAYSEEDVPVFEILSNQVSNSIEKIQAKKKILLALEKAQESDSLKTTFLQNLSHELRTPMNGILGFTELMKEEGISEKDKSHYLDIIEKSSKRLLNLIHDLVDISKIETGQITIHIEEVNANQLIREVFSFFEPEAHRKGLHLFYNSLLPDTQGYIPCDRGKIAQVLSNLVSNAIKYTDTGSIEIGNIIRGDFMEFFVRDTGIGIKPGLTDLIFERFRQSEDGLSRKYEGSGLGLTISKAFIEQSGGKIWVESTIGKGSTFAFSLPLKKLSVDQPENNVLPEYRNEGIPKNEYSWKGKKILLVEDDDFNMDYFKTILKGTEASLYCVYNAFELRKWYNKLNSFDVILLDIRLPDASGWDLVKEIKAIRPDVPVIAQTAYALSYDKKKSELAGCDGYIAKPIKKEMLLEYIAAFIRAK